jgi:hypothetical protein
MSLLLLGRPEHLSKRETIHRRNDRRQLEGARTRGRISRGQDAARPQRHLRFRVAVDSQMLQGFYCGLSGNNIGSGPNRVFCAGPFGAPAGGIGGGSGSRNDSGI